MPSDPILSQDTVVDVRVGEAVFVAVVVACDDLEAIVQMDGLVMVGTSLTITAPDLAKSARVITCQRIPGNSGYELALDLASSPDLFGGFQWPGNRIPVNQFT